MRLRQSTAYSLKKRIYAFSANSRNKTKCFCRKRGIKRCVFGENAVYAKIWLCKRILNLIFKILEILDLGHICYWMMPKKFEKRSMCTFKAAQEASLASSSGHWPLNLIYSWRTPWWSPYTQEPSALCVGGYVCRPPPPPYANMAGGPPHTAGSRWRHGRSGRLLGRDWKKHCKTYFGICQDIFISLTIALKFGELIRSRQHIDVLEQTAFSKANNMIFNFLSLKGLSGEI